MAMHSDQPLKNAFVSALAGTFAGLLVAWPLVALGMTLVSGSSFSSTLRWSLFLAFMALIVGGIPSVLYGTLAYGLLLGYGRASYLLASCLGALPGAVALAFRAEFSLFLLVYGIPIALSTHAIAKHLVIGADKSSKPEPLRGSDRLRP